MDYGCLLLVFYVLILTYDVIEVPAAGDVTICVKQFLTGHVMIFNWGGGGYLFIIIYHYTFI